MTAWLRHEAAVALQALQFLTRLPLPAEIGYSPERMAASPRWYPAVGALIGGVAALVYAAATPVFPPVLAVLVSTAAGLWLTGCLHEDGLADTCDGLGGGATRALALEIMRDSRLGTYGAVALGVALGAKVLALGAPPPALVPSLLIAGHAASRASSVLVIASGTYARDHGTGKPVAGGIGTGGLAFALASALLALLPVALLGGWAALGGGLAGLTVGHALMRWQFGRKLGGYTGDCLGAVQQASELGFYLGALACL
jgi:adenosylcobinamide-GDP ribazoletransferase